MFQKRNHRMRLEAGKVKPKKEVSADLFMAAAGIKIKEV